MRSQIAQFFEMLGWDGLLPLVTASGPLVLKMWFANQPMPAAAGLFLVLAPPIAALIRAHIGRNQIVGRCGGRAPIPRQIALAAAIMVLFVFEAAVTVLTFENNAPLSAWWIPIGAFTVYLAIISYALRPCPPNLETSEPFRSVRVAHPD